MKLNIVMCEPEIPQNTGNIARTCAIIGAKLHLIHPLGFKLDDKKMKRAGLDYWDKLDVEEHDSLNAFMLKYSNKKIFYATTKAKHCYADVDYTKINDEIFIMFGRESKGLPEDLLKDNLENTIRIPMRPVLRSLNLANSVCVIAYEIMRQFNFENMLGISDYF